MADMLKVQDAKDGPEKHSEAKLPTDSVRELSSDPQMAAKKEAVAAAEAALPKALDKAEPLVQGKADIPPFLLLNTPASAEMYNETLIGKLSKDLIDSGDPKAIELAKMLNADWANRDKLQEDFEKKHPGQGEFFPGKGRLCCCKSDGEKAQNFRYWLGTSEHTANAQCHGTNLGRYFPPKS
jgi:hypothetical protein